MKEFDGNLDGKLAHKREVHANLQERITTAKEEALRMQEEIKLQEAELAERAEAISKLEAELKEAKPAEATVAPTEWLRTLDTTSTADQQLSDLVRNAFSALAGAQPRG